MEAKSIIPAARGVKPFTMGFTNSAFVAKSDNPETIYDWLGSGDRDVAMGALSATNRRTLILEPGVWTLTAKWELDIQFLDVVSLSGNPADTIIQATGNQFGPAVEQTVDDVRLIGFTMKHDGTGFASADLSATGDHAFVVNVSSMTSASLYKGMIFTHDNEQRNNNAVSLCGADNIEGVWENCVGGIHSWNMITNKNLNGEFFDCTGDYGGLETGVEIGGKFYNCFGIFGGSTKEGCKINSSALLLDCEGAVPPNGTVPIGLGLFALGAEFAGTAINCNANSLHSFGGTSPTSGTEGDFTGVAMNCTTLGGSSFGMDDAKQTGASVQSGVLINCRNGTAGDYAAGRSGARPSVVTDNGTAGSVTVDPDGANNDITFTSRFKSSSASPIIFYDDKPRGPVAINIIDKSFGQIIDIDYQGNSNTAADITNALDASDTAIAIMTWTVGGAGTIPPDAEILTGYVLTGGVNTVHFSGNHPTAPSNHLKDFTVFPFDNGHTYKTTGAGAAVTAQLPAALVGYQYHFEVTAAQELRLEPNGTETIALNGTQQAAGSYIAANAVGERCTLTCATAGQWEQSNIIGTWTVQT